MLFQNIYHFLNKNPFYPQHKTFTECRFKITQYWTSVVQLEFPLFTYIPETLKKLKMNDLCKMGSLYVITNTSKEEIISKNYGLSSPESIFSFKRWGTWVLQALPMYWCVFKPVQYSLKTYFKIGSSCSFSHTILQCA